MGCWTSNFNRYDEILMTTLPIIVICSLLLGLGALLKKQKQFFTVATAITYLTLPTVTTMIFSIFPCDGLDNEKNYLRSDYSIDCDGEERRGWEIFGGLMIATFPVGVTALYWRVLWVDRKSIMKPVSEREEDETLMAKAFLFEAYKPEFWYFEVVETLRRLSMTGLLSTIRPGSYTQLSAGLLMGIAYVVGVSNLHPYVEQRDNIVAILTGCQLILVFMTASFMKFNLNSSALEDEYDLQGMGVVLICSYVIIFCLFFAWAIYQKDDEHVSTNSAATKLIKRLGKASASARIKHKSEIELSERSFGGEETFFAGENPMARNPKKNSNRNLAGSLVVEEEDAEEEIVKPPAAPPTCPWTRLWDEGEQEFYYVHEDGKTSTWDTPAEFFKK